MSKRREQPRLKFGVVVKEKGTKRQGTTRNISIDGCFINREGDFTELLPVGSPIELLIRLPNAERSLSVSGIVKHHGTHEEGMGIAFVTIDDKAVAAIEEFIQAFLDDLSGEDNAGIRDDYRQEVERFKGKTSHNE
jgi:hypothetical protein